MQSFENGFEEEKTDDMTKVQADEIEADEQELDDGYDYEDDGEDEDDEGIADDRDYNQSGAQVSEEELDEIADLAIEEIRKLIAHFDISGVEIDEYEGEEGELILDIVGGSLAVLIGRHGKTLDALQFLVTAIISKKIGYRYPIIIDVEGYKQRRKQKLVSLAKSSAARAIRQKHKINLRPMNPYERRIIHIALREERRIKTSSEGVEPNRFVVIQPN